jgi:hypothetical protein
MEHDFLRLLWSSTDRGAVCQQARLRDLLGGLLRLADERGLDFWAALSTSQEDETPPPLSMFDPRI